MKRRQSSNRDFENRQDIHLAVVWKKSNQEFLYGAMLAMEEINTQGGVAGRMLKLQFTDETPFLEHDRVNRSKAEGRYRNALTEAGTNIARAVMTDPRVTAVIGHMHSDVALSAMLAYQENGILLLSANSTDSRIVWSTSNLYFQLRPTNEALANYLTEVVLKHHWRNCYVVYEATRHNEHVAELLKTEFSKAGIRLVGSVAITEGGVKSDAGVRRLQNELATLSTGDVDVILLLAPPAFGAQIVNRSRSLGVFQPFIGTSELEVPEFMAQLNQGGGDMFFTSLYRKNNYQMQRFGERLAKRFPGAVLNESAAMGYDSVRLYAETVASAGTTDPLVLAHSLQYKLPVWYGTLGSYVFKNGNNRGLKYYTHRLSGGADGKTAAATSDD